MTYYRHLCIDKQITEGLNCKAKLKTSAYAAGSEGEYLGPKFMGDGSETNADVSAT